MEASEKTACDIVPPSMFDPSYAEGSPIIMSQLCTAVAWTDDVDKSGITKYGVANYR